MRSETFPYPVRDWRFWRAYGVTLRPYLLFVSGASGLVGLALAPTLQGIALYVAAVAFFLCYGLGQAITDTFQTDTDALSSPYRPLVRGEITPRQVLVVSLGVDAAAGDPESPLEVTRSGFAAAGRSLATPGLPTVFVQEGGYDLDTLGDLVLAVLTGFEETHGR